MGNIVPSKSWSVSQCLRYSYLPFSASNNFSKEKIIIQVRVSFNDLFVE